MRSCLKEGAEKSTEEVETSRLGGSGDRLAGDVFEMHKSGPELDPRHIHKGQVL